MERLIGLSLSFCIKDVIEGHVEESEIKEINARTLAFCDEDWSNILAIYCQSFWQKEPDKAREIFYRLLSAGKIKQPRLDGKPRFDVSNGYWEVDDNIKA